MASTVELRAILRDEISAGLKNIEAELAKVGSEGKAAGAGLSSGMSSALPSVQGVTDALGAQNAALRAQRDAMKTEEYRAYAKQQREIKKEIEELEKANGDGASSFMTMSNAVKGFMALQVVGYLKDAAGAVFSAAMEYDSLSVRLRAVEGSATVAADRMAKLIDIAKQPGIGLSQAAAGYTQLRALNVTGAESIHVINGIARANAAMGGGAEEFGRAMNQITQAYGKQKLMGEELMTLSESIPNIRGIINKAFGGMSMDAINAKYSINEVMLKIADAAEKLPPAGDTIKNATDNISDGWKRMLANFANVGLIKGAENAIASLIEKINVNMEKGKGIQTRMAQVLATHGQTISSNALMRGIQYEKLSKEERKYIDDGVANTKVYASNLAEQEKIDQKTKEAQDAKRSAITNALTKLDEKIKKTDIGAKIKEENEAFEKQKQLFKDGGMQAGELAAALEKLEKAHKITLAEISKKSPHEAAIEASSVVLHDPEQERLLYNYKLEQKNKAKMRAEDIAEDKRQGIEGQKRNEEAIAAARRVSNAKKKYEEELADLEYQRQLHNQKMIDGAVISTANTMQNVFSNAFMEIGKKHGDLLGTMLDGFESMLNKMVADLAANAAVFGILSIFSGGSGGLAASFAEGAGGLTGALFGQRAGGGAVGGGAYLVGEHRPEIFRPTVPGSITNNSHSYGGVTINVSGGSSTDPRAIAKSVSRALQIQSMTRSRGSR